MKMLPVGDRILCERVITRDIGGIEIPDVGIDDLTAIVIAVGDGLLTVDGKPIPMEVKVGDKVLFQRGKGTVITSEGKEYWLFNLRDLVAVVE